MSVILSDEDIALVTRIIAIVAARDKQAAARLENAVFPDDQRFWTSLDSYGFTFVAPPEDAFSFWYIRYGVKKRILSCEGPMWTLEHGDSPVYLYLEKYIDRPGQQWVVRYHRMSRFSPIGTESMT